MSNILVAKNYKITDHSKWYDDKTASAKIIKTNYNEMEQILVRTAKKHVAKLDDIIVHRGEAENIRDVFKIHFKEIYDLWKEGHNILYCDLDVMFLRPVTYFGNYDKFTMFNLTDPPSTKDSHYGLTFDHFFNCGMRYYPSSMDNDVWEKGFAMLENWNPDRWDCEQIIYNAMMFAQSNNANDFYDPVRAFQVLQGQPNSSINENFNNIKLTDACAVHLHGSRHSESRLEMMHRLEELSSNNDTILLL
jgi:hypothetical protein